MRISTEEFGADYRTYRFGYARHAYPESIEESWQAMEMGFLPYSADPNASAEKWYQCRSLRIDLSQFRTSSENRRILRIGDEHGWSLHPGPAPKDLLADASFLDLAQRCTSDRFSTDNFPQRLPYILSHSIMNQVLSVNSPSGEKFGCVLMPTRGEQAQYWFAFFEPTLLKEGPIGKWMMLRSILRCQELGLRHLYLGTCYGTKALYKVRDHTGCEFWDGEGWNTDVSELLRRCHQDEQNEKP